MPFCWALASLSSIITFMGLYGVFHPLGAGRTWWKASVALVLTAQLLPAPSPAVAALADGPGRLVVRASFRSASPEAASALGADLPATAQELFAGESTIS